MLSPGTLGILLLFGLPIVAVVSWVYLKQLEITSRSGDNDRTRDLERTISTLEKKIEDISEESEHLQRRIRNLETIVTSESWDELHARRAEEDEEGDILDPNAGPHGRHSSTMDAESAESPPEDPETDSDRAARRADRLRGSS